MERRWGEAGMDTGNREGGRRMSGRKAVLVTGVALLVLVAALLGGGQSTAQAVTADDAVLDWNLYATQALINAGSATPPGVGQPAPVSVLHLGIVQAAVYDAVNMIDGSRTPYLDGLPAAPANASKSAAVTTAAHNVLVGLKGAGGASLLPSNVTAWLGQRRDDSIGAANDGNVAAGIAAGAAAAQAMLAARANDGRYTPGVAFTEGLGIGEWRPTSGVNDPNAWIMVVKPFAMTSAGQFRTEGPAKIGTARYRAEYQEVKSLGGNGTTTPSDRTSGQTATALFFSGNPVELFNRTFRGLASSKGLSLVEQARLFATLNLSGADAAIGCWADKEYWGFWRPITAIRLGDTDGDPGTEGDANWTSLVAAPPYPDQPSGYNCQSGSFMQAAKGFFHQDFPFTLTSGVGTPPVQVTRPYDRFTDVVDDTVDARVWNGLHFRSADQDGAWIGKRAAQWVNAHLFTPAGRR